MPLMLATCALLAAYHIGGATLLALATLNVSFSSANIQTLLHAGVFIGLAGVMFSVSYRPRWGLPMLFLGGVAVALLLAQDMLGVASPASQGWNKDLFDLGQRAGLLFLFGTRFEALARQWRNHP